MEFSIEVEGLDELAEALGARLGDVLPAAMKGVGKAAKAVEKDARKLAPVAPVNGGNLRRSIHATAPEVRGDAIEAKVVAGAEYAVYVEYGTGVRGADSSLPEGMPPVTYSPDWAGQTAQPYMYPAMKKNEQKTKDTIADEVRKAVEK